MSWQLLKPIVAGLAYCGALLLFFWTLWKRKLLQREEKRTRQMLQHIRRELEMDEEEWPFQ